MKKIVIILISLCCFNCAVKTQNKTTTKETLVFQNLFDASINDAVECYRIPAIVTAPNGDVIAAIDERVFNCGDLKWSKNINIIVRRSSDNGEWFGNLNRQDEVLLDLKGRKWKGCFHVPRAMYQCWKAFDKIENKHIAL